MLFIKKTKIKIASLNYHKNNMFSKFPNFLQSLKTGSSSQDGGTGRHGSPLHTSVSKLQTKIQNNHHSEPSEIRLNGSPTTTELKEPHPSRLAGGVHRWDRLVPHQCVVDKNLEGIYQ